MEARALGTHGPVLSVVGVGCNNFGMRIDAEASAAVVRAALDAGVTHFDTAEMYGGGQSEAFLGRALGANRDRAVIATKFTPRPTDEHYTAGALARRIRDACEASLRRLGTDRIDLYYQHYPDPDAPIGEALETLEDLVREGKVLHVASSNPSAELVAAHHTVARERGLTPYCGIQVEWSLLARGVEAHIVPAAAARAIGIVPYFPLASGLLTGKYRRDEPFPDGSRLASSPYFAAVATEDNFAKVERLTAFAGDHGHDLIDLAVGWLLSQPGVSSVIAGATTPAQVQANAAAAGWRLDADKLAEIDSLLGDDR